MTPDDDAKQLGLPATALLLAVLASIFGFAGPAAAGFAATAGGASAFVAFFDQWAKRRNEKRLDQFQVMIKNLEARLAGVMIENPDERVDLFVEVVLKALEDDEKRKTPFYESILEWIARRKPSSAQVRILSDAVKSLSYVELYAFVAEVRGQRSRNILETDGVTEYIAVSRRSNAGLGEGGIQMGGSPTALGRALIEYLQIGQLEAPNKAAGRPL